MDPTGKNSEKIAVAVIPARYGSTRLPGKPLLPIAGKALILWVVERALAAQSVSRAIVATDDERIFQVVTAAGFEARMTSGHHASGTNRVAEVARDLDAEIIVNVQGDEPLIEPGTIDRAVRQLVINDEELMATTSEPIAKAAEVLNPAVVKVVTDDQGYATSFSRNPIPWPNQAVILHGSIEAALGRDPALLFLSESTPVFMFTGATFFCSLPPGRRRRPKRSSHWSSCARWSMGSESKWSRRRRLRLE